MPERSSNCAVVKERLVGHGTAVVVGVGAETGLGAGLARRLAQTGFHVIIAGRTKERLDAVAASLRSARGHVDIKVADAAHEPDVVALFNEACSENDLGLVIYNVGTTLRRPRSKHRQSFSRICGGRMPLGVFL